MARLIKLLSVLQQLLKLLEAAIRVLRLVPAL